MRSFELFDVLNVWDENECICGSFLFHVHREELKRKLDLSEWHGTARVNERGRCEEDETRGNGTSTSSRKQKFTRNQRDGRGHEERPEVVLEALRNVMKQ